MPYECLILTSPTAEELQSQINDLFQDEESTWKPIGNVFVSRVTKDVGEIDELFVQMMVNRPTETLGV